VIRNIVDLIYELVYYECGYGMRINRYFLLGVVLLLLLGTFLAISVFSSRRVMLDLMKEQARSLLSVVASTQENLIFAEARLEDGFIDKLIGVCNYIDRHAAEDNIEGIRQSFGFSSILVFDASTKKRIRSAGIPIKISERISTQSEPISFEYFDYGNKKFMRFVYVISRRIYQIELPADEILEFRTEFGINKIINMMSTNPIVKYLVLQDREGILFATPNVQTLSRIDDDPFLAKVMEEKLEADRIAKFNEQKVLELARPFIVEDELLGIFRIGISLDSYNLHVRRTEGQLVILFVILFGTGFILFLLFMNYQSYVNIKELFDKTLGAVEDGVLLVGRTGVVTGANKMFSGLSGYDESILIGRHYDSVFTDDPFDFHKVLDEGRKVADEKSIFGKHIQYATYPLSDKRQEITGVITILHDVSKIKEYEKEREEAERLVFLGNLVANFAHEIKNPLNGLSIATQRLVREFPSKDGEYTHITKSLKKEIDALNKIVNDFLVLARPKMKERVSFRISTVLGKVKESVEHQLHEYSISFKSTIEADTEIIGNADDFRRALLNIFLNAIDAVAAVTERPRKIEVRLVKSERNIVLTITDNGIGMDDEEAKRIFSQYFTTKKSGTGLGLFIAQKIIKDHGGTIKTSSEKNRGTIFTITFEQP
jgi:PAS domain S-box-containing protein